MKGSLAARNNKYMKIIKKQGIECFPIDWNRGSFNAYSFIKNIIEIRNIIKTIKPEIVHLVSIQTIITGCLSRVKQTSHSKASASSIRAC